MTAFGLPRFATYQFPPWLFQSGQIDFSKKYAFPAERLALVEKLATQNRVHGTGKEEAAAIFTAEGFLVAPGLECSETNLMPNGQSHTSAFFWAQKRMGTFDLGGRNVMQALGPLILTANTLPDVGNVTGILWSGVARVEVSATSSLGDQSPLMLDLMPGDWVEVLRSRGIEVELVHNDSSRNLSRTSRWSTGRKAPPRMPPLPHSVTLELLPPWVEEEVDTTTRLSTPAQRMALANRLVARNIREGTGGPFATVITDPNGGILGVGVNRVVPLGVSPMHGEGTALAVVAQKTGSPVVPENSILATNGCTCGMCMGNVIRARVKTIEYGATTEDIENLTGFDEGIKSGNWAKICQRHGVTVVPDILRHECALELEYYKTSGGMIYNGSRSAEALAAS